MDAGGARAGVLHALGVVEADVLDQQLNYRVGCGRVVHIWSFKKEESVQLSELTALLAQLLRVISVDGFKPIILNFFISTRIILD